MTPPTVSLSVEIFPICSFRSTMMDSRSSLTILMKLSLDTLRFIILIFLFNEPVMKPLSDIIGHAEPLVLETKDDEGWWGGRVSDGASVSPWVQARKMELLNDDSANQSSPVLISNHGQWVWSARASFLRQERWLRISWSRNPSTTPGLS